MRFLVRLAGRPIRQTWTWWFLLGYESRERHYGLEHVEAPPQWASPKRSQSGSLSAQIVCRYHCSIVIWCTVHGCYTGRDNANVIRYNGWNIWGWNAWLGSRSKSYCVLASLSLTHTHRQSKLIRSLQAVHCQVLPGGVDPGLQWRLSPGWNPYNDGDSEASTYL